MKLPLLIFLSLSILALSRKVTVTKSFSQTATFHTSNPDEGSSDSGPILDTSPPENPGAENFNACDIENRPEVCTLEYAPVCGYIHECEGGTCNTVFGNGCQACALDYVVGYVNGTCEDAWTLCNPENRPEECAEYYTATCAVAGDCEGSRCFENVANICFACRLQGAAYSLPGECPGGYDEERVYCTVEDRLEVCTADYNPVCAHTENCLGSSCWNTAGNACGACGDRNVDFYYAGECSDDEEEDDGRVDCDVENRPEVCTADFNPVCAHVSGCEGEGDLCWNTAGNGCSACGDENVDYYVPGEC